MQYKHIFFDLDHTLWDFDKNAKASLTDVFYKFDLRRFGVKNVEHFQEIYMPINQRMWGEYRRGEIDAETVKIGRFQETFKLFNVVDHGLTKEVKEFYLKQLPVKGALMPNTLDTLNYLKSKYELHIVTNGFRAVTDEKISFSNIGSFFKSTLSAEEVGVLKPNKEVFERALSMNNTNSTESLFVGDSIIADVEGARGVGMDQVLFNPHKKAHTSNPTYEISDIGEMMVLF